MLVFVILGIVLADMLSPPLWVLFGFILLFFSVGLYFLRGRNRQNAIIFFGLTILFFSAFHFSFRFEGVGPKHISNLATLEGRLHMYGRVVDWPRLKTNRTEVKVALDSVQGEQSLPVSGAVVLYIADSTTALQRGDRVQFSGRIYPIKGNPNPGRFDFKRYMQLKGVYGIVYLPTLIDLQVDQGSRFGLFRLTDYLRDLIRECFYRNLSLNSAALASGFLIGETRDIPPEIYRRFRDSGTLHLLAVSGSNVALVLLFCLYLIRPLGLSVRLKAGALLAVIGLFAMLSYGDPSVIRASVMASLIIFVRLLGRKYELNNIIALTALIILLVDPLQLFDVGFQLSFITAWGLIFFVPRLIAPLRDHHNSLWYRWLLLPFVIALVAQIVSTPIVAFYFHRLPLLASVANLAIVAPVSLAVVGILVLLGANVVLPLLASFFGSLLDQLLTGILLLVNWFGGESMPVLGIPELHVMVIVLIYAALILAVLSISSLRARRWLLLGLSVSLNLLVGSFVVAGFGERTIDRRVDIFSIPAGVSAIIHSPGSGRGDLVLTGLMGRDYPIEERIFAPALDQLQIVKLDRIIILSLDYGAIDDILRLSAQRSVDRLYLPADLMPAWVDLIHRRTVPTHLPELITFGDNSNWPGPKGGIGFYLREDLIRIVLGSVSLDFVSNLQSIRPDTSGADLDNLLVVGSAISPELTPDTRYHLEKYSMIVSTRLVSGSSTSSDSALALEKHIHSLARDGSLTLDLTDGKLVGESL